ncbi:MAG: protein-L-isoaspartate(D-aspartate) O-methyltransferase [Opitutales bacterium]|jgi:protein-L-isoaspartate(D-aspartate) O-methyltransferase
MKPDERVTGTDPGRVARERMVAMQIEARGVRDERVLAAMRAVPREAFVPRELEEEAFEDHPLPIGHGQTISQPYVVALMTELAEITAEDVVLEIGTGCGYQTAVLAELAKEVYSIEVVPALAEQAAGLLVKLGHQNVRVRAGDGYEGWPERAPFDAIVLTAAPPVVPEVLLEQLKDGGRLVVPEGSEGGQMLRVYQPRGEEYAIKDVLPVRFVPMVRMGR